jgi:soluble lytic murein transglycosylase-like protein
MHRDCGYRAYTVISVDDLYNPFASMYFGASYLAWLSRYEGRLVESYEKLYSS